MRFIAGRRLRSGHLLRKTMYVVGAASLLVPGMLVFERALASAPYMASDLLGQTDSSGNISWTTTDDENRRMPDSGGFGWMSDLKLDRTHHKLYVSESTQNDILVFNLDSSNQLVDRVPDYILGSSVWADFATATTTQSGLSDPEGMALDEAGQRLFVADRGNNRILMYDVSSLANGMNAARVLGQPNFTAKVAATTQTGMNGPQSVAYDATGQRLFVGDDVVGRVLVFGVSGISNGQAAANVIGKANFTSTLACVTTQTNICRAYSLAHDDSGHRLFVADYSARRVLVFNTAAISDGEAASNVLGQPDYTTTGGTITANSMLFPDQLQYDATNNRLIESDFVRVLFYDVSSITNGQAATDVLGQPDFTSHVGPVTDQSHMYFSMGVAFNPDDNRLLVIDREQYRILEFDITTITNGENAINEYGQTDGDGNPVWDMYSSKNRLANSSGLSAPEDIAIDTVDHRLFVADMFNNRVLVYNLDSSNNLIDRKADAVLGQPDMAHFDSDTTQSTMDWPEALAYDATHKWLYVAEYWNHRVLVFDTATVSNGENALYVLGQADFTSNNTSSVTASSVSGGDEGLAYDAVHNRLFVGDAGNNRVLVFDMTNPSNNMLASYEIGQPNFVTNNAFISDDAALYDPYAVAYDANHDRLYVSDSDDDRILVFDMTQLANGMSASYVLGQPDFTTYNSPPTGPSTTYSVENMTFDPTMNDLFVTDSDNRVLMFDTNNLANNMNASVVFNQPDFGSSSSGYSQSQMGYPLGLAFDPTNRRLYVVDDGGNRVMIYDTVHITTASLPGGTEGQAYAQTVATAGTQGTVTSDITTGALPPGLAIDSAGNITGTPTSAGTYSFTVTTTDDNGAVGSLASSRALSIVVAAPPSAPTPPPAGSSSSPDVTDSSADDAVPTPTDAVLLNDDTNFTSDTGSVQTMTDGSAVTFTLGDTTTDGDLHTATVNTITDNYIDLTIASDPINLRLYIGDSKQVDVDRDGTDDLSVTLLGIVNQKAQLIFRKLITKPAATSSAAAAAKANTPSAVDQSQPWPQIIMTASVMLVLAAVIIYAKTKKHQKVAAS